MDYQELLKAKINGETYASMGRRHNVSRQRIQQILSPPKELTAIVWAKQQGLCARCGKYIWAKRHTHHKRLIADYNNIANLEILCLSCHTLSHHKAFKNILTEKEYRTKYYRKCSFCGAFFTSRDIVARLRRNTSGKFFCSKHCQGKWLGTNYGKLRKT